VVTEQKFASRDGASAAVAARIAGLVSDQLIKNEKASFAVSGGTSPAKCFDYLSAYPLRWKDIQVALTDERWVPNFHNDSNERLVRQMLLLNDASSGRVLSIFRDNLSVEECCEALQEQLPGNGFACVMAGMGADGHFASLFPDSESLQIDLDLGNERFYIPVCTDASPHPRISMTLAAMLRSNEILLLFFGEEKLKIYEQAKSGDTTYPIAALLAQQKSPVTLYWAP